MRHDRPAPGQIVERSPKRPQEPTSAAQRPYMTSWHPGRSPRTGPGEPAGAPQEARTGPGGIFPHRGHKTRPARRRRGHEPRANQERPPRGRLNLYKVPSIEPSPKRAQNFAKFKPPAGMGGGRFPELSHPIKKGPGPRSPMGGGGDSPPARAPIYPREQRNVRGGGPLPKRTNRALHPAPGLPKHSNNASVAPWISAKRGPRR